MNILVTGATGFLGGEVVRQLTVRGDTVYATGRNREKGAQIQASGTIFICADLADKHAVSRLKDFAEYDAIVHCAALSSPWGTYDAFANANITATENMLDLARHTSCKKFIFISSPSIYFDFKDQLDVTEDHPLPSPVNHYALTKAIAEVSVINAHDVNSVILRPRALYGCGDTSVMPRLIRALERGRLPLLRQGRAVTNLTHVEDAARAVLQAIDADTQRGRAYNIAGNESVNVAQLTSNIADKLALNFKWLPMPTRLLFCAVRGLEAINKRRNGQPEPIATAYSLGLFAYSQTLSIKRASVELGWEPKIDIQTGLKMTFDREDTL